jgi:hypothetical protein
MVLRSFRSGSQSMEVGEGVRVYLADVLSPHTLAASSRLAPHVIPTIRSLESSESTVRIPSL